MRSAGNDDGSRRHRKGANEPFSSQSGTPSSSFVSTLSNALNISTPKSSKPNVGNTTPICADGHSSAPDDLARAGPRLRQSPSSHPEALRTPTRSTEPPPTLSLSGHEAFFSPNTPISPWPTAPTLLSATGGFDTTHGEVGYTGQSLQNTAPDQEWLLSAPKSGRSSNIFVTNDDEASLTTSVSSMRDERNNMGLIIDRQTAGGTSKSGLVFSNTAQSSPFASFHDLFDHESRFQRDERSTFQQRTPAFSTMSPATLARLSPLQISSVSTMMDSSFLNSVFEQDTPCLSTHLLPNNDLTEFLPAMESTSSNSGRSHFDLGIPDPNNSANHAATRVDDKRLAGLGLDLNTQSTPEHIEVLASPAQGAKKAPMVVDEMGRWMIDTQRKRLQGSWFSEATAEGSENGRGRWEAERASTASLSTATEASFTSHSNSSTWDSSFAEVSSPPSGAPPILAESQFISTPASSIGFSGNSEKQVSNVTDPLRWASERRSDVATPEVAMHDFSEFGQSVSIEQMAEERWRTWPRSSDAGMSRARLSTSAASLGSAAIPNSLTEEPRTSSDSLSVSTSSTRSRLMAEPYNKNMRSGRPGSSASTSSRSSIGNAAALDAQQTSSGTGPTRPRSLIAAGSLRMSSTTRTGSSGGVGPDASQIAGERVPSTAMALRRARGMSHSIFSSSGGSSTSSAMKSTKSADAFIPNASFGAHAASSKHSAALPRSATSLEGSRIVLQKPDSILGTSSYSDSSRPLGAEHKTKARVGFNEVSAAVDTLRMFLKQKSDNEVANSLDESPKQIKEGSSPSKPSRTLRRAKGVLPPRGAVSHVDEFGSLQTIASPSNVSLSNDVSGPPPVHHHRSQSLGGPFSLPKHATPPSLGRQDDKLAVLEDLSERVMRLKAKTEMERERHAAASMPPPTARPASMMHQRTQSSMTRREMHEEYLRKRASDT